MSTPTLWKENRAVHDEHPDWRESIPPYDPSGQTTGFSDRVTHDDRVWGGMATVAGTRVPVFMLADLEAEGESVDDIHRRYPHLTRADIYSALAYAHAYEGVVAEECARYHRIAESYRGKPK